VNGTPAVATPRRIGLLGAESTGKTTLAEELAHTIDAFIAEEYLRDFVRDYGRVPTLADQEGIFLTQQATVMTVMRAAAHAQVPAADFEGVPDPGMRDGTEIRARTDAVIADLIAPRLPLITVSGDTESRLATLTPLTP